MDRSILYKIGQGCLLAVLLCAMQACNKSDGVEWKDNEIGGYGAYPGCLSLMVFKEGEEPENTSWQSGNSLGMFLTKDSIGNPYEDNPKKFDNIRSEYRSGIWFHRPGEIQLTDSNAVIYAYTPYEVDVDPEAIYVETHSGFQYMYGTHHEGQSFVNYDNPKARIMMKNALAMIDIRMRKKDYNRDVVCTSLTIQCKDSTAVGLPVAGTLNICTEELTPDEYGIYHESGLNWVLKDDFVKENQALWTAFPYDLTTGEVELVATINGQVFRVDIDGRKDWHRGYRTVYNVIFTGKYLTLTRVDIAQWINHNHYLDIVD